jgi:hypothetical protein
MNRAVGLDRHTVALWLFDEPQYPHMTLTDAGPNRGDLRLLNGASLVPGRYGNALAMSGATSPAASYACPTTGLYTLPLEQRLAGDRPAEALNLGYYDWTIEFWFRSDHRQGERGILFVQRNFPTDLVKPAANWLAIDAGSGRFLLHCDTLKLDLPIPTDASALADDAWHHHAFTFTAHERQIRHFVDGRPQPLPARGGFLPLMGALGSFTLGGDQDGSKPLAGCLDELRVSDVARYRDSFEPPESFSRNYRRDAPAPSRANGPPLLFAQAAQPGPIPLGDRKHVFIDGALLDACENLRFVPQSPQVREITDFHAEHRWEAAARFGSGVPDILHVYDDGGQIRLVYTGGGMWSGKPDAICLATSADGLHWEKPELGVVWRDGSTCNNIVLADATQGTMFCDPNPDVPDDERYKYVAYCMYRGIYVYLSADGIHWRRNETIALPFDCGGGVETFWDDQRGLYATFIRHEGLWTHLRRGPGRACALAETHEILKPWPFAAQAEPGMRTGIFALPSITEELPIAIGPDAQGREVYRSKAVKYPWAPDTYVAFPWRYKKEGNVRPGSDLAVSRDGAHWHSYGEPFYLSSDWELEGRRVVEALMDHGMARRGDEVWQYATARFTAHGGAAYGGEEYEGGMHDRLVRLRQRLDGFVALEAGPASGSATTRALTFQGGRLSLNLAATGRVRVALLDARGQPLPGFGIEECDAIHGDALRQVVRWRGDPDVGRLAGRAVRLRFELQNAKLYAFQFR